MSAEHRARLKSYIAAETVFVNAITSADLGMTTDQDKIVPEPTGAESEPELEPEPALETLDSAWVMVHTLPDTGYEAYMTHLLKVQPEIHAAVVKRLEDEAAQDAAHAAHAAADVAHAAHAAANVAADVAADVATRPSAPEVAAPSKHQTAKKPKAR